MKIIVFNGGLGNQMFEYAYYRYLQELYPNENFYAYIPKEAHIVHNGLEISTWFDVALPPTSILVNIIASALIFIDKIVRKFHLPIHVVSCDRYVSKEKMLHIGNFQDWTFCDKSFLKFRNYSDLGNENAKLLQKMQNVNSVAVHVRRGDYLISAIHKQYAGLCTPSYYKKAIAEINKSIENPVFFFFSDDKKYVEETFDVPNKVIVTCNKGKRSFFDMYLMAHCKNMIVANSTFSWWAAYLNTRAEKIYCPIRWNNIKPYPNLILEGWHVVEP